MGKCGNEAGPSSGPMYVSWLKPLTGPDSPSVQCAKARIDDLEITESHFAHVLRELGTERKAIHVWDLVDRYQLDVATHVFFGTSTDSLITNKQPFRQAMETLLQIASYKMSFG